MVEITAATPTLCKASTCCICLGIGIITAFTYCLKNQFSAITVCLGRYSKILVSQKKKVEI